MAVWSSLTTTNSGIAVMQDDDHTPGRPDRPSTLSSHHMPVGSPVLADLERYWRSLQGHNRLPQRTDVNPAQIDAALPHSFILERVAPGVTRMRVAGQQLNAYLGMEARGMPLSTFFDPAAREKLRALVDQVFDRPALVDIAVESPRGLTRPRLTGRMIFLPLAGPDGTVNRALGAILTDGMIGRSPRRFTIPEAAGIRIEPVADRTSTGLRRMAGLAEAPAAWTPPRPQMAPDGLPEPEGRTAPLPHQPAAARPWLRLVVSNV